MTFSGLYFLSSISPYLLQMQENADQKNSKYGQLSRSDS